MATIVSMKDFSEKRGEKKRQDFFDQENLQRKQEKFAEEMLAEILNNARYLPRTFAIKLIQYLMLIHYIDKEEL